MTFRAYLSLVEAGTTCFLRSDLARWVTPAEHAVLRDAGLVRPGPAATSWHCDQAGKRCGREVVEAAPACAKPFVAVCEGAGEEEPCPAIGLTDEELARETIAIADLARLIQAIYRLEGDLAVSKGRASHAGAEPVLLGAERGGEIARDVFLAPRPDDAVLAPFLALRERLARATLVLVPTAARVGAELGARYAPGGHVQIEALEDAIAIRDRKIVRATKLHLVPRAPAEASRGETSARGIAALIGAPSFAQIRVTAVDGHTLRIACGKKSIRRTYVDLGLHTGNTREPTKLWDILMAVCQGHGTFRWKRFGAFPAVSTAMTRLRKKLCAAFGLDEDPFHPHHSVEGWKARFFASSEIADED